MKQKLWILLFVLLYVTSYLGARQSKLLIYRVTYATNIYGKVYSHSISTGDFGIPWLSGIEVWLLAYFSYVVYTPLTLIESGFWFIVPRQYNFGSAASLKADRSYALGIRDLDPP